MDKKQFSFLKNDMNGHYLSGSSSNYLASKPEEDDQVLDMNWVLAVLKRRALVMVAVAATLAAMTGSLILLNSKKTISEYEGKCTVLVEPVTSDDQLLKLYVQAQNNSLGLTELSKIKSSAQDNYSVDYQSLTRVLKSPEVLAPLYDKLQKKYPKLDYNRLYNQLNIQRVSFVQDGKEAGTKLLEITYKDRDSIRIKDILEETLKYYLQYMRQERLKLSNQGLDFINQQIPELQQKVDKLQNELQTLRTKYNFNQPEVGSRLLSDQINNLAIQLVEVESQLAQNRQLYETYEQRSLKGDNRWIVEISPKSYESLMGRVNDIESQVALSSTQFYEDSLPIKSLKKKQQSLRDLMQREAKSVLFQMNAQIQQLESRQRVLSNNQKLLKDKLILMPEAQRRYEDIQLQLDIARENLKLFLGKQKTLQLDSGQINDSWKVLSKPELVRDESGAPNVVKPKPTKRHLAIAFVISSLLGLAVGFLVEVLHTVFHTPEEIRSATKCPLLGVIPIAKAMKIKSRRGAIAAAKFTSVSSTTNSATLRRIIVSNDKNFPLTEAFHYLYTNIQLLSAQEPINSLTITSTVKGEGKSTVAVYLAKTASAVGKRVLLVDANMRSPQLHAYLNVSNARGLSNILTSDLSVNEVIQQVPDDEHLFVLTAGTIPPDPIKLLSSRKMHYLMEQFLTLFDLVIYDTPALIGLADGHLLASQTNGTVLIVKIEKTNRELVNKALYQLNIADFPVFGVVANGVKM